MQPDFNFSPDAPGTARCRLDAVPAEEFAEIKQGVSLETVLDGLDAKH
jgi:hypothetical protein